LTSRPVVVQVWKVETREVESSKYLPKSQCIEGCFLFPSFGESGFTWSGTAGVLWSHCFEHAKHM